MSKPPARQRARARQKMLTPIRDKIEINLVGVPESCKSFQSLIAAYAADEIDRPTFTALVYSLNCYANYLRLLQEAEIEERLRRIEEKLNQGGTANGKELS